MIGIETLLKDLNEALNVNLADNSRRFKIIQDGGEYAGFTREKNNISTVSVRLRKAASRRWLRASRFQRWNCL